MYAASWRKCLLSAIGIALITASPAWANGTHHTGTVPKFSQPIGHLTPGRPAGGQYGENIPSDVDWHHVMESATIPPNWVIADDFEDPVDRPVITVRWWGSYLPDEGQVTQQTAAGNPAPIPIGPGVEDAYLISFFSDIPGPRFDHTIQPPPTNYSRPGDLLGSYIALFDKVRVKSTNYVGWDQHRIWEYEADLWAAHLEHESPYARPEGFFQQPGKRYWISIAAEVGHTLVEIPNPIPGSPPIWEVRDTGKEAFQHYWGWHTSPLENFDVATMSHLLMPGTNWQYLQQWQPIDARHHEWDMAFELLTIPEPTGGALLLIGLAGIIGLSRRR